jgi:cleavage and polyadenylation specificity factor subunit 4
MNLVIVQERVVFFDMFIQKIKGYFLFYFIFYFRKECPFYKRGVCKVGPNCKNSHIRYQACPCYLAGFCPDGPTCKFSQCGVLIMFFMIYLSPRFEQPTEAERGVESQTRVVLKEYMNTFGEQSQHESSQ